MKTVIIGLGTGRCGTHSLAALLNNQENTSITHEMNDVPFINWCVNSNDFNKLCGIIDNKNKEFVGDVSFFYLPYIPDLLVKYDNIKFISIKRPKESTIKSYMKWTEGRNHWITHNGNGKWRKCIWDKCYPKYEVENKEEALNLYWEEYYSTIEKLKNLTPDKFLLMEMEDLNDDNKIKDILNFCGFKNKKIISGVKISKQRYVNS